MQQNFCRTAIYTNAFRKLRILSFFLCIVSYAMRTIKEKVAANKARRLLFTRTRNTSGEWTYDEAVQECEEAGFKVHSQSRAYWNQQTISPSYRKMFMSDGAKVSVRQIMSGATRAIKLSPAERKINNAKVAVTREKRGYGQMHWMEIAAFTKAFPILNYDNSLEYQTVPDQLLSDFLVRTKGTDLWSAIQVKSSIVHEDADTAYRIKQSDGEGKYKHQVILAVGLAPGCTRPSSSVFENVSDVEVKELFLYNRAGAMLNKTLEPYPRRKMDDKYGDTRYVFGFDSEQRLNNMRENFKAYVNKNSKWTKSDAWFGLELNPGIEKLQHYGEVLNNKALANLIGIENLRAPMAQNECVDVIAIIDKQEIRISLKTCSVASNCFFFHKRAAPNSHFCDVVLAFYHDKTTKERTHVSVLSSKDVYCKGTKNFCWSPSSDVYKDRTGLCGANAAEVLSQKIIGTLAQSRR